jgi:hypothetical protein
VRVCPGCGIIAPFQRTSCNVCQAPFTPLEAPGRVGPLLFACIHAADFACNACGQRSPLLTIDLSGQAECLRCGLVQAFDIVQWTDALDFAHGVADVSGPAQDPVAARSRHAQIGIQYTSSTKTQNSFIMDARGSRKHTLATTVSPGHPLCTCKTPLEVVVDPGASVARTRCPRCNDEATYALPNAATSIYAPLRAVLANEQRTDKPVAKTVPSPGGIESAACPQCGGSLQAGAGAEIVKCVYCNVTARVPGRLARRQALQAAKGDPPKMPPIWILVEGPSSNRKKLSRGKTEEDDDDDDDELDEDDAPAPFVGQMGGQAFVVVPPGGAAPAWAQPSQPRGAPIGLIIGIAIAGVVVIALIGGGVAFFLATADDEPPPKAAPAPARPATPPPPRKR